MSTCSVLALHKRGAMLCCASVSLDLPRPLWGQSPCVCAPTSSSWHETGLYNMAGVRALFVSVLWLASVSSPLQFLQDNEQGIEKPCKSLFYWNSRIPSRVTTLHVSDTDQTLRAATRKQTSILGWAFRSGRLFHFSFYIPLIQKTQYSLSLVFIFFNESLFTRLSAYFVFYLHLCQENIYVLVVINVFLICKKSEIRFEFHEHLNL